MSFTEMKCLARSLYLLLAVIYFWVYPHEIEKNSAHDMTFLPELLPLWWAAAEVIRVRKIQG